MYFIIIYMLYILLFILNNGYVYQFSHRILTIFCDKVLLSCYLEAWTLLFLRKFLDNYIDRFSIAVLTQDFIALMLCVFELLSLSVQFLS